MSHARQQYQADGSYVDKQLKEFSLTQEIIEKLDSIEPSAERNAIQGVKVNGQIQTPDQYRVVDLTIPEVVDNLDSYDNESSLSARQGRVLYSHIKNLEAVGKFLSNWNCTTGLPTTNPSGIPYDYHNGDYFVVSVVGSTNYRPDGSSFVGSASTVVETELVQISDIYFYDGVEWLLMHNSARAIAIDSSLSTSSTNPVENRVVTQALNTKQEKIVAGANIQIAADGKTISATDTTYDNLPAAQGGTADSLVTTGDKYNWNNKQGALTAGANIQIAQDGIISATDTVYGAGANVQINGNIISATDTTYTAGTGISIDSNNVISNTQTSAEWGNITGTLSDQTDLQNALNAKQGTLTAGANIQITGNTISATDTTYTASDFDIKDLADSTGKRASWDAKQNAISDLATIRSNASTAIQPNDNVSALTNDAGYITSVDIPTLDTAMSDTSTKGVQNKVIKSYVDTQVSEATAGAVSDTAYAASWNGVTGIAPSKNAVYDKISAMDTTISGHTSSISTINGKIPSAATASNQLADKNYVDDSINSVTAYYITKNATGDQWATRAELFAATTFYSGGVVRVPTKNDYTIVLSDENHDNATTRYIYNNGWEYQYTVNETALTQAQLNALNSGITSGKVSTYDGYASTIAGKQDALSTAQLNAVNSGITSGKVSTYDGYATSKQDTLVSGTNIKTVNSTSLLGSGNIAVQPTLVSGTNIKTVKGTSLLGSGNIAINEVPSSGTTGYVLTKTSSGYGWSAPTGGIQLDANSPITVSKLWVGTESQYSALSSYSDDTVYMTV